MLATLRLTLAIRKPMLAFRQPRLAIREPPGRSPCSRFSLALSLSLSPALARCILTVVTYTPVLEHTSLKRYLSLSSSVLRRVCRCVCRSPVATVLAKEENALAVSERPEHLREKGPKPPPVCPTLPLRELVHGERVVAVPRQWAPGAPPAAIEHDVDAGGFAAHVPGIVSFAPADEESATRAPATRAPRNAFNVLGEKTPPSQPFRPPFPLTPLPPSPRNRGAGYCSAPCASSTILLIGR